jgi:hypothetical protein
MVIMIDKSELVERRREILGEAKRNLGRGEKGMVLSHPRVRYDDRRRTS